MRPQPILERWVRVWCFVVALVVVLALCGRAQAMSSPVAATSVHACTPSFEAAIASQLELELDGWPTTARVRVVHTCDAPDRAEVRVAVGADESLVEVDLGRLEEHLGARAIAFLVQQELESLMVRSQRAARPASERRLVQAMSYLDPELAQAPRRPSRWSRPMLALGATFALHPLAPTVDLGLHLRGRFDWFEVGVVATSAVASLDGGTAQTLSGLVGLGAFASTDDGVVRVLCGVRLEGGVVGVVSSGAVRGDAIVPSLGADAAVSLLVPLHTELALELGITLGYRLGIVLSLDGLEVLRVDGLRAALAASIVFSP